MIPFKAAIAAGTAAMMPYYGVPMDSAHEHVGFSYNKGIITDLLRNQLLMMELFVPIGAWLRMRTWGCMWPARAWGVQNLDSSTG